MLCLALFWPSASIHSASICWINWGYCFKAPNTHIMDTHSPGSYFHLNIEAELTRLRGEAKRGRKTSMSDEMSSYLPVPPTIITARHWTEDRSLPTAGHPKSCQRNTRPRAAMEEGCSDQAQRFWSEIWPLYPTTSPSLYLRAMPLVFTCRWSPPAPMSTGVWPVQPLFPEPAVPTRSGVCFCLPPSLLTSPEKGQGTWESEEPPGWL